MAEKLCVNCGCPVDRDHPGIPYEEHHFHGMGALGCVSALKDRIAALEEQVASLVGKEHGDGGESAT